jgi:hypothetical protein
MSRNNKDQQMNNFVQPKIIYEININHRNLNPETQKHINVSQKNNFQNVVQEN